MKHADVLLAQTYRLLLASLLVLAATIAVPPAAVYAQINVGLVAHWNAENGATDVTGNDHNGAFVGNAATTTSGPYGKAFTFDGNGDYIDIGDELDMGTSNFTLAAWLNGDPGMHEWARIFDKGFASAYSLHRRGSANTIGFEMLSSGNAFATTSSLIDNTWHHVALVKNGTTVTIYADGVAENTNAVSAAAQNNTRSLLIGFNPGEGTQGYWKGMLDELRIYDRALVPSEVATLANVVNPIQGLIAHWNAENGAADVTGNGHDGAFVGNAATTTSGPFGKAFTFDGNGDYISIGDELDMGTSNFTLSAWVNGDPAMHEWARIFDKGFASAYSLHRRGSANTIGFEMLVSGNSFATTSPLIDNTWHHVALVKEGTTLTIYADGVAENTNAVSAASQDNALPLLIGFNPGEGTPGYWKGMLDELKIFDRALTPLEIAALATNPNDLDGDLNHDGVVDAADYVVWRENPGGIYDQDDYNLWRANFGRTRNGSAAVAIKVPVPEPATQLLVILGLPLLIASQRVVCRPSPRNALVACQA